MPKLWVKFGSISTYLAKHIEPLKPPLLILSSPRSGSSWVGEILGAASNAMYLREPLNQGFLACGSEGKGSVFKIDQENPPKEYKRLADMAFSGMPVFSSSVAMIRNQWNLLDRKYRRLVIKEVNPYATDWFLKNYRPRVIFIVRHPAAITLSYLNAGFHWNFDDSQGMSEEYAWQNYGREIGSMLSFAWDNLKVYPDYHIIHYEKLCLDPLGKFHELFKFAGLNLDSEIVRRIGEKSSGSVTGGLYETSRNSRNMVRAWDGKLTKVQLAALKTGYSAYGLPWYEQADDW